MKVKNYLMNHKGAAALILAIVLLWFIMPTGGDKGHEAVHIESEAAQVWTCSMHPNVQLPEPGQCPICFMDLIPLADTGGGLNANQLSMSENAAKLADIQTAPVSYGKAEMDILLSGKVEYDESRIGNITAWVPGRLERMFVDYTGISVKKGDHMMELYSPELYAAQEELIQARKLAEVSAAQSALGKQTVQATLFAAREKLRLMGLVDEQIRNIESSDSPSNLTTVYSPMTGVVIEKNGVEGAYVKTGTNIYTIADLSRVWVILDAYETDLIWLAFGQNVSFTAEAVPGETFEGRIAFIDPVLDPKTRTVKVRLTVLNSRGELKPGMFVHGTIHATISAEGKAINPELADKWICPMHPEIIKDRAGNCDVCGMGLVQAESMGIVHSPGHRHESLLIPASAVLRTGERAIVYVKLPGDELTFEGREIVLGPRVRDQYVVKSGLKAGEEVVVKGNFKIDSAMQISAKPSMMNPPGGARAIEINDKSKLFNNNYISEKYKVSDQLKNVLNQVAESYFIIQNALAEDRFEQAQKGLGKLNQKMTAVRTEDLELPVNGNKQWEKIRHNLVDATAHHNHWQTIEAARKAFKAISESMAEIEQLFGLPSESPYYEIYCPMAFGNAGASWLSRTKDVNNPYFGARMLKCGEVKRTIGGNK